MYSEISETAMKSLLAIYAEEAERYLDKIVPEVGNPQSTIYKAMRYSLLAGGKRIRPVLALAMGELLGAPKEVVLPFACALEMIHTYSLIHDDLPAMDNDDLRRGRPTCHVQYGEAMAILAGDALLNKAFEVMSAEGLRLAEQGVIKSENVVRIIAELSKLSGSEGMIGGQVVDLESEGKSVGEEILRHTYACKTGALLKSPVYIAVECARGAAVGDADSIDNAEKALLRYSELIGLAFQIKDDILDVEGDSALLGKETGSDDKENKTTMVTIFGIEKCKEMLSEMTDEAVRIAGSFGDKGAFLRWLALFLLERNY